MITGYRNMFLGRFMRSALTTTFSNLKKILSFTQWVFISVYLSFNKVKYNDTISTRYGKSLILCPCSLLSSSSSTHSLDSPANSSPTSHPRLLSSSWTGSHSNTIDSSTTRWWWITFLVGRNSRQFNTIDNLNYSFVSSCSNDVILTAIRWNWTKVN